MLSGDYGKNAPATSINNSDNNEASNKSSLSQVMIQSTLFDKDPATQTKKIVEAFNRGREDITVESVQLGKRINQDEFRLVHRNNQAQLVPYTYLPRRLGVYATGTTEEVGIYKQTALEIGAHGSFLVNVPQGKLAKAWIGNTQAVLLGQGPHVFHHPNFKLEKNPLVSLTDNYIQHGNLHIIRVPRGKLAAIWLGAKPILLESQEEPYVFDDPTFSMTTFGDNEYFIDANTPLITHGSIKRILPSTCKSAIAYNNGQLEILTAADKPFIKDSPTYKVQGFIQTAANTLVFPSKETQDARRKSDPKDIDGINYERFTTEDGLPIGVAILVVYEVVKPELTLTRLRAEDIVNHIENIVVADMRRIVSSCNSSRYQLSNQTTIKEREKDTNPFSTTSGQSFITHVQDEVKSKLAEDLIEWGIKLIRVNFEDTKILDKELSEAISKNSLITAKNRADASNLSLDYTIKQQRANQEAEKQRIETERARDNKIVQADGEAKSVTIAAQAQLDAARLKAEAEAQAIKIKAQANLEAAKMAAEGERVTYENNVRKAQMENEVALKKRQQEINMDLARQQREYEMKLEFLTKQAAIFSEHEPYRQMEIAKAQASAVAQIGPTVISPDVAAGLFAGQGLGLFQQLRGVPEKPKAVVEAKATKEAVVSQEAKSAVVPFK